MTAPRVLVLALDGASVPLIDAWSADGTLPHIGGLRSQGLTGATQSVDGYFVGATWPSLCMSRSPASHGIYNLLRLRPGTYDIVASTADDLAPSQTLWECLSGQGKRVAVLDVPLSPLVCGLNGIQVVEWGCHDVVDGFCTWPSELAGELLDRHGPHPIGTSCDANRHAPQDYLRFEERLLQGVRAKAALSIELLRRERWDFFMQVFSESHCAGHQAWHSHDAAHPAHHAAAAAGVPDVIRSTYVAIDAAIGTILAEVGPETIVWLLLPHSMSHWYGGQILLHDILVRLGVTADPSVPATDNIKAVVRDGLGQVWGALPGGLRRLLTPLRDRTQSALRPQRSPNRVAIDPAASRCFPVHMGFPVGGIRLNLIGREPAGTLARGADADAFCDELIRELRAVVDPQSGQPLVRDVWRTADRFRGERIEELPDLCVEWSEAIVLGGAAVGEGEGATLRGASPRIGVVEATNRYCRSGEHRPQGMFIVRGPGISPGRLERVSSILDLAPTIARALDCEMADAEGQAISELCASLKPGSPAALQARRNGVR